MRRLQLTGSVRAKAREPHVLIITKANSRATVHRSAHLDYIGIKEFDDQGAVVGERRVLGLFTSDAYTESVFNVPVLGAKVMEVLRLSGYQPDGHDGRDLVGLLQSYPRDELFQTETEELLGTAKAILHASERRQARLFVRRDVYGRFYSVLVYLPKDRYTTTTRLRIEAMLREVTGSTTIDYATTMGEGLMARLHYVVRLPTGSTLPELDQEDLERRMIEVTRAWGDELGAALVVEHGEEEGGRLAKAFAGGFPEAYKEDFSPRVAVIDLAHLVDLQPDGLALNLYQPLAAPPHVRRMKVYRREPLSLSRILPFFTHLGLEVTDERPYHLTRLDGTSFYVYDFGLSVPDASVWDRPGARLRVQDALADAWHGRVDSDDYNGLVVGSGLTSRQVVILRAVSRYLRQAGTQFSAYYLAEALLANGALARLLVELFEVRFDPDASDEGRAEREAAVVAEIHAGLDEVASLDQDRIVRSFLAVIQAGLRTNFFQVDADGHPKPWLSIKLDPQAIAGLPEPRPEFEIWVYGPRVEGVHLRFGPVARGGLRWSDRREDFRTEILGLVKAQMVKNAVIVPTGSKGGFFAKQLPDPAVDRDAWLQEGIGAYTYFISGLLDLTDNRVGADVVAPDRVVRHDGDDPYLVVAADKGTATFSDIANAVAQDYGFWLDDAFASGGSAGYDHKGMGITARGAWESVKRHFRELGVDTQTEDFTVVGVGDMSGDVFGNGMLLSEHIRLVGAFDHRHIFVDPDPDAASSYAERRRLFELPRSSWDDYDRSLLSEGVGSTPARRSPSRSATGPPWPSACARRVPTPTATAGPAPTATARARRSSSRRPS
ncbi:hypothetical protein GCM10025862_05880 [Arsenicicoccus piscis]|uniref:Glutamate dehydrogenase n=1 Tax=Arsenicicoccus piscis TaxID=673954 RepID=A0ABQ6HJL9_9MICO|nr:hypothetical protein GCM10025862_05880 [Arsenicicoccus piscis]